MAAEYEQPTLFEEGGFFFFYPPHAPAVPRFLEQFVFETIGTIEATNPIRRREPTGDERRQEVQCGGFV